MAKFAWLLPSLIKGSGGHRTIFQCASALEARGHQCSIYLEHSGVSLGSPSDQIKSLFGYTFESVFLGWQDIAPADVAVATVWYSAAIVRDLQFPCKKLYLVQDWEALFNPIGDAYIMAENSYLYGLIPITIGRWLPKRLQERFSLSSYAIDFGVDLSVYFPADDAIREYAICFIYQPEKPRRCSRLGLESLGIVKHYRPEAKIYLYGSSPSRNHSIWFEHSHLGLLSLSQCRDLYTKCQVGLCISASNPSRIPFEMMASGLPVVDLLQDNTIYDFPSSGMLLSEPKPESIASALINLLDDPSLCFRMGSAGAALMENRPLHQESLQFCLAAEAVLAGQLPAPCQPVILYKKEKTASKIYPRENLPQIADGATKARILLNRMPPIMRQIIIACVRYIRGLV